MSEGQLNLFMILGGLAVAAGIFVALLFVRAPYGRHFRRGWGPLISNLGGYLQDWLHDPRFLIRVTVFLAGYIVNRWADLALRGLRKPGETGYRIPYGGLFRWVSCPNYLGEIVEWSGWALATCRCRGWPLPCGHLPTSPRAPARTTPGTMPVSPSTRLNAEH